MTRFNYALRLYLALAFFLPSLAVAAADVEDPVADPAAVVTAGNARFTVLTPRLIRMEWSPNGKFEDNKTLTIVNRRLPVPKFTVKQSAKDLVIKTADLTLTYRKGPDSLTAKNLSVRYKLNGKNMTWTPGADDSANLLGTTRTLDGLDGDKLGREPLEKGLLSRDGWSVIDDSRRHLLVADNSAWREWVASRPEGPVQDIYLLAYGHDYKAALADYQKIAGRAPLPPKYTFGYWWSRYWQYSDNELVDLVDKLKSFDIPIDVLIVDMDWHETYGLRSKKSPKDAAGQRRGWTGYTWQKELFPAPSNFLEWTNREGLKVALNLHPASGIQTFEAVYPQFAKDYNWTDTTYIPFHMDEQRWADVYFADVLRPMERDGVDFWWLDWQQWPISKYTPGLSNTFWLNHTFFRHAANANPEQRPFIYHRWGGLGSHRYPLGFSGDTYVKWPTLAFLPYFTSTSSNVNYGYWGHDIGGHMLHRDDPQFTDPELYLRWLQYGVFTPIFKTHSTKNMSIVRYPWAFPDHQFMMRDAIRLRYALAPYIYQAARTNFDTGVAMTRPMYYEYPEREKAYNVPEQFFFGPDILATVIAQPVDSVTGLAERTVWFPEGRWYDFATGDLIEGNTDRTFSYTLAENPWYGRAGAIIPMNPDRVRSLQQPCDTLVLTFVPGADGSLNFYEDDGISADYETVFATTDITKTLSADSTSLKVNIAPRKGTYKGASDTRSYELRFPATRPPVAVTVNGRSIPYARFPEPGTWTYDAYSLQPVVYTDALSVNAPAEILLSFDAPASLEKLYGLRATFNRCLDLTTQFKTEQGAHGENMKMLPVEYLKVSQCPNFILEDPANIDLYINDFQVNRGKLFDTTDAMTIISPEFKQRLKAQIR